MAKIKEYEAAEVVNLQFGRVKLTAEQAAPRMHCLSGKKNQKSGVFEIVKPIQFKVGESFGYDGDIPKSMLVLMDEKPQAPDPADPDVDPEGASDPDDSIDFDGEAEADLTPADTESADPE